AGRRLRRRGGVRRDPLGRPARTEGRRAADRADRRAAAPGDGGVGEARPRRDRHGRGGAAQARQAVSTLDLKKALAGGSPPHAVLAVGPEAFLREEALRACAEGYLGAAD